MQVRSPEGLSYFQNSVLSWRRRIRHRVATHIHVSDEDLAASFACRSAIEERRAATLFQKEPGTISWLRNYVRPGDTVVDIGANVGIYTVLAAKLVGQRGKVFAFEPHAVNFSSLMENIALNEIEDVCVPISTALADQPCHLPFHYASLTAGSSMSQLGRTLDPDGRRVDRGVTELKAATSLDRLIEDKLVQPPQHIKIDVDGIEASIVEGMTGLLCSDAAPVSVQIEIQADTRQPVIDLMTKCNYRIDHCHHTLSGQQAIANGVPEDQVTHNIVFTRSDV